MFCGRANLSKATTLIGYAIAILGGIWFGLFSCGGYAWHKWTFWYSLCAIAVVLLFFPIRPLPVTLRRIPAALGLFVVAFLVRSLVAAFYPGPPDSISSYISSVWLALTYGPC